jgi:hypothetical protein
VSGPHDFAVRSCIIRPRADARLTLLRPLHPAPNVRDDREAPLLWARDSTACRADLGLEKTEMFLRKGLDRLLVICPSGQDQWDFAVLVTCMDDASGEVALNRCRESARLVHRNEVRDCIDQHGMRSRRRVGRKRRDHRDTLIAYNKIKRVKGRLADLIGSHNTIYDVPYTIYDVPYSRTRISNTTSFISENIMAHWIEENLPALVVGPTFGGMIVGWMDLGHWAIGALAGLGATLPAWQINRDRSSCRK